MFMCECVTRHVGKRSDSRPRVHPPWQIHHDGRKAEMTARLYLTGLLSVFIWRSEYHPALFWMALWFYSFARGATEELQWGRGVIRRPIVQGLACFLTHTRTQVCEGAATAPFIPEIGVITPVWAEMVKWAGYELRQPPKLNNATASSAEQGDKSRLDQRVVALQVCAPSPRLR